MQSLILTPRLTVRGSVCERHDGAGMIGGKI